MKLNFKDPLYWLIILALSFFLYGSCERSKRLKLEAQNEKTIWNQRLEAERHVSRTLADSILTISRQADQNRAKDSLALNQIKRANSKMAMKLAELRVPVQVIADTLQPLRDYLILADSLSASKDTLIHEMTLRHSAQIVDLHKIISLQESQIMQKDTIASILESRIVELESQNRKQRRKTGFWKVTSGILAGGILYLAVKTAD